MLWTLVLTVTAIFHVVKECKGNVNVVTQPEYSYTFAFTENDGKIKLSTKVGKLKRESKELLLPRYFYILLYFVPYSDSF
jgi:hypothetical protein